MIAPSVHKINMITPTVFTIYKGATVFTTNMGATVFTIDMKTPNVFTLYEWRQRYSQ